VSNNIHSIAGNTFSFYAYLIKKRFWNFFWVRMGDLVHYAHFIILPFVIKLLIDALSASEQDMAAVIEAVKTPMIYYILTIAIAELAHVWTGFYEAKFLPKISKQVRQDVLSYVLQHSDQYFSDNFAGTIGRRINELAESSYRVLYDIFHMIFSISCAVILAILILFTVNTLIAVILSIWLVVYLIINYMFAQNIQKKNFIFSKLRSELNGKIVDVISNIKSVKYFSREAYEQNMFNQEMEEEIQAHKTAYLANEYSCVFRRFATFILAVSIFIILILLWAQQQVSLGDISFITTIALLIRNYAWTSGHYISYLSEEVGITKEALEVVRTPITIQDQSNASPLVVTEGKISLDNIRFFYNKSNINIFNDFSLDIKSKQKIGLVGPSGAGKSSLMSLLLRFYDVQSGNITIDGQNIAYVSQESLRQSIAVIPQDTLLFHRNLMDNIRYGRVEASDEEVIEAAKKAYAHEFIYELEDGYKTMVGERGVKLSGGQRQRIAVARAILKDAPILILDEATSALDSQSEKLIQDSLKELMKDKTVIAIAHRLSTIAHLDRLIVMDQGRIVQDGTHNELKEQDGLYSKLWNMQSGGFLGE